MVKPVATHIGWAVGPIGYKVLVLDHEAQPIEDYRAGNNPGSSAEGDAIDPDEPDALGRRTLEEFAMITAREFADEHGLPPSCIYHDQDEEANLVDEYEMMLKARSGRDL